MLVQISCAATESLPANFDEHKARVTPHVQYDDTSEYIVAWRKNRLELYKNYVSFFRVAFSCAVIYLTDPPRIGIYSRTQETCIFDTPAIDHKTLAIFFHGFYILHHLPVQALSRTVTAKRTAASIRWIERDEHIYIQRQVSHAGRRLVLEAMVGASIPIALVVCLSL